MDLALGLRQQPEAGQGFSPLVWGVTVTSRLRSISVGKCMKPLGKLVSSGQHRRGFLIY